MSSSVGTMRAGSNKHSGPKEKTKNERGSQSQQSSGKGDSQTNKVQPTQEQIRLAEMMNTNQTDADVTTIKALVELTGKSEDVVVIALHDADNDADRAVMMLLEGNEQTHGEWKEQGGKRKKKTTSSQKENSNHVNDDRHEGRNKDKGDRDWDKEKDGGNDRQDGSSRRGRRNGGPPPRLARGRGRDRGNFGDREKERNNTEDWDNEKEDERGPKGDRDKTGGDRGRSRGRGGFARRTGGSGGGGSRGGRFNNSGDRDNRSYNRVPRFEKMNNPQPIDGPEIDTWTNETAEEKKPSKDTDWNNWNDTWVMDEDQWTGTLEETKVFTPSQMKIPEPEPVISEPPSSLGQRLDVGSLFIESAKFSTKAPDYSKPSGDSYITQFNQAATESIKNTIGIGSSSRQALSMSQQSTTNALGLSSLAQQHEGSSVLSSLQQQSASQAITQMSQIAQSASQAQAMSQIGMGSQQAQVNNNQAPAQSRIPSIMQQQSLQPQTGMNTSMSHRPKSQRSKLPPPSKIPSSAVEMPGHIPRNPQLDLQFGIDFSSEPTATFGFGGSGDSVAATSSYSSTSNGTSSVISSHLSQGLVSQTESETEPISNMISSPQAGSGKGPSGIENQAPNRPPGVFHNSVYPVSPSKNDTQNLEQNKLSDAIPFPPSQLERKSSPLSSQRTGQPNQNLSSGSLPPSKDSSSNYTTANGYASTSYPTHQKASSQSQTFTHSSNPQAPQSSSFPGQYPASQPTYPGSGQSQFSAPPSASQFPSSGQYNNVQNQYSAGQNQFPSGNSTLPHQSQYSGTQSSYGSSGQSQYSGYQNNSSFSSHPPSQSNFSSSQTGGSNNTMYPSTSQSGVSSYTSQSNSYQSPSAGSYHSRDTPASVTVTTQSSSGVSFPNQQVSSSLKPVSTQSNTIYSSPGFNANTAPLQPPPLANKLGDSLSKITLKENNSLDGHQTNQFEHTPSTTTTVSASLSLPSATSTTSLSTGTSTISSTSTVTSITSTSRIASMPSTCKAPPNLPPVPLMGQYIMGQSTIPPFYSVQPPLYGYEDVQLLQQRMPLQTGNYYDMSAFPAQAGSTLPTGREQQPPIPNVPFTGTSADTSKLPRVDAQSPNASSQQQNQHSAAQQPLFNFHYGYYYPSMFHGAAGLQYPMFPIPPGTNAGTTSTTQFQPKSYPSHVYTTKGYEELNQAQDFSKTGYGSSQSSGKTAGTRSGTSDIAPNAYSKSHTQQGFDKQGFHGGTPPPFSLPLAPATQAGPMGAPTTPYGAPFLPVMAAHQAHSQMMHHPIQQDSNSSSSRGINQTGSQAKSGAAKSYAGPTYWNN